PHPPGDPWAALLRDGLVERLRELVTHWRECLLLTERLLAEKPSEAAPDAPGHLPGHVDPLLVALSGLAATGAVLIGSALWIGSGWAHGASMAMMGGVALCIFGQLDDPAPALKQFLVGAAISVVLAGLYQFAILPRIDGLPLLLLVLAILYIPVGALMPQPTLMAPSLAIAVTLPTVISLQESYVATDFASYADGGLATLGGLGLALLLARLARSFGVAWRIRRLAAADRLDLARLAEGRAPTDLRRILGVMLDRFEALAARLGAVDARAVPVAELSDLRAALNMLRLREQMAALPAEQRRSLEGLLQAVAAEARGRLPATELLGQMDRTLASCAGASAESRAARQAALSISGLRLALFPEAPSPFLRPESLPA
uniref:FUSC family protein n=1 Tax=Roseomonas sp. 18066 TaxID=2681412 RepID=UPI00190F9951